jgi:homoserine O-acetyltransferase
MQSDAFQSSDSIRGARPLRYVKTCALDTPLHLERGGGLLSVTVAYETYGTLNAARDNAVLICHALSGDSHVAKHDETDDPGWWDLVVGPGKSIDTERYFVICPNILGGCRGTTGPLSVNPDTGKPYGADFPVITVGDIVEVQKRLIDHLGIQTLLAVVGGSLGGHMALTWAIKHPQCVLGVAAIATSPRLTSQALAFDVVGRNAILSDPNYNSGQYYSREEKPDDGLAIARMLGHITYLSREAMTRKFDLHRLEPRAIKTDFETRFAVGSYLAYQGNKFVERFDANSYVALTTAMDLFDLGGTQKELMASLAPATCRWLVLSFSSDWLFPPFQSQQIADALISLDKPVSHCNITSGCGHDAFLLPDDLPVYGEMIRSLLASLGTECLTPSPGTPGEGRGEGSGKDEGGTMKDKALDPAPSFHLHPSSFPSCPHPNPLPEYRARGREEHLGQDDLSIFHEQRLDYDTIVELIPKGASVLDLGCGSGELLARLKRSGHKRIMGVELDQHEIVASLRHGLDVVQGNLNAGLPAFADGQFDVVLLSQTLQTVMQVERVLKDMLRVGRMGIVSFPNLAYRKLREMLGHEGRAPRAGNFLGFNWYNSPNVRFLSIADFQDFCTAHGIQIRKQIALNTEEHREVTDDPNLNADVAVVLISR